MKFKLSQKSKILIKKGEVRFMILTKEIILENKVKDLKKEIKDLKKKILIQNATAIGFGIGFTSMLVYLLVK